LCPREDLIQSRDGSIADTGGSGRLDDFANDFAARGRQRDKDFAHRQTADELSEPGQWTEHRNPVKLMPMFRRVVVDESDRRQAELRILPQLFRDFAARVARSRNQDATNLVTAT